MEFCQSGKVGTLKLAVLLDAFVAFVPLNSSFDDCARVYIRKQTNKNI